MWEECGDQVIERGSVKTPHQAHVTAEERPIPRQVYSFSLKGATMNKCTASLSLMLIGMVIIGSLGILVVSTEAESEYSNGTYFLFLPVIFKPPASCESTPTLIGPADESNLDTLIPLFTIDPSGNPLATKFKFHISIDPGFTSPYPTFSIPITNPDPFEFRLFENLNQNTTYYWRAWHICDGVDGPFTEIWSFTTGFGGIILPAPSLIAPANGSTLTSLPETFEWTSVSGAIDYVLRLSKVGFSGDIVYLRTETQVNIDGLDPDTTYEWWVAARNDYAVGDPSAVWQFNTPSGTSSQLQEDRMQLKIESDENEIVIIR